MRIRSFRESDIIPIDKIWKKHHSDSFSVPNRYNALTDCVTVDDSDNLIAYGQVKLFAEAIFILDLDASRVKKTKALILLMHQALFTAGANNRMDLKAFIKDPDFALLIEKHFDFKRVTDPGELLVREE